MGRGSSDCRRALTVALVLLLLWVPMSGGATVARSKVGPRVTIAVYGDSVVEGYTIPHYLRDSFVPQLRIETARVGGFALGGTGLIPVTPFRWRFNSYTVLGAQASRPDAWALAGFASHGPDGPSGYSGIATSPQATATAPVDGRLIGVLFTKFSGSSIFTVTAGSQTFPIDGRSTGPPTPSEQWITVPPGTRTITVHGPGSGEVIFDGVIVRNRVPAGQIGVEVENLGHMGHRLTEDSGPRILGSLLAQRFDISVFVDEYNWLYNLTGGRKLARAGYAAELRARVGLARTHGGLCLIADPAPIPLPASVLAGFTAINRTVARENGCAFTDALTRLWRPAEAVKKGITLLDGIHPRALGYRLIARALAPVLVGLVRERVRTRGH